MAMVTGMAMGTGTVMVMATATATATAMVTATATATVTATGTAMGTGDGDGDCAVAELTVVSTSIDLSSGGIVGLWFSVELQLDNSNGEQDACVDVNEAIALFGDQQANPLHG